MFKNFKPVLIINFLNFLCLILCNEFETKMNLNQNFQTKNKTYWQCSIKHPPPPTPLLSFKFFISPPLLRFEFLINPLSFKPPHSSQNQERHSHLGGVRIALYSCSQHFQLPISHGTVLILSYQVEKEF